MLVSDLAPQQREAFDDIVRWYEGPDQLYYLAGWAGTGKSSIASVVAEELVGLKNTVFAAYTGKAALVMRNRGCPGASTMHSFIYCPADHARENLTKLKEKLKAQTDELLAEGYEVEAIDDHPAIQIIQGEIFTEEQRLKRPRFVLNSASVVKERSLGYLDEVSMVDKRMACDWMSFGRKTLVTGDPAQLPPVGGEGFFTKRKPNFMLTEIHRQARDNPIVKVASMVRQGERPEPGHYGSSKILRRDSINPDYLRKLVLDSDQIIVGRNKTRHQFNNRIRSLRGFKGKYPEEGETLVCLRNNHELGLLNGALYTVRKRVEVFEDLEQIKLVVEPSTGGQDIEVSCHTHHFVGDEESLKKQWYRINEAQEFDFGYALTCHKVQGSQFRNPIIFDESGVFRQDRFKWLYTALTRAVEEFTLIV